MRLKLPTDVSLLVFLGLVTFALWGGLGSSEVIRSREVAAAPLRSFESHWGMAPVATPTDTTTPTVEPTDTLTPVPTEGEIFGFVRDSATGLHISGATVTAYLNGSVGGSDQTDVSGHYVISDLPPQTYQVVATASGYQQQTQWATLSPGESKEVNFYLDPLVSGTATPSPTITASPTSSPTDVLTWTATPSSTPTPTNTATASPTETHTDTATASATSTPTSTDTWTPTATPTSTATTATHTATPTASRTATGTRTPTPSATASPTTTLTPPPTFTPKAWLYVPIIHKGFGD